VPAIQLKDDPAVLKMLEQVPIFSALGKKQLKNIIAISSQREYPAGEVIEKEGDMGITFYMVLSGAVEVRKGKKVLAKLGRGQFFGEMALLDKQPRSATVVAVEPTRCMLTRAWNWAGILSSEPKMAMALLAEMARRLRETDKSYSE
jgi:CRP-like cAMP-binding protein